MAQMLFFEDSSSPRVNFSKGVSNYRTD